MTIIFYLSIIIISILHIILEYLEIKHLKKAWSALTPFNNKNSVCAFRYEILNERGLIKYIQCIHPKYPRIPNKEECTNCGRAILKVAGLTHKDYISISSGRAGYLRRLFSGFIGIIPIIFSIVKIYNLIE
jgi:hypothetical protein